MKNRYLLVIFIASLLYSCNDSKFVIKGRIACHPNCKIYLDAITPGEQELIDSTTLDGNGNFKFAVKLHDDNPAIYNLRLHQDGAIIPLILKRGDNVKVNSVGDITRNYIIDGSEESELVKEISSLLSNGAISLDSLANLYVGTMDTLTKNNLRKEYLKKYQTIKKEHIKFVVANVHSIAAIYALYQRLPNDETLFGNSDILYYKMVADSTKSVYPNSPYVKSLEKVVADYDDNIALMNRIQDEYDNPLNYPEIELPDMYNNKIKLSDSEGKVILVDFWTSASAQSKQINTGLKELYEKYSKDGFEVYQVSIDTSKSLWTNAVQEQKLPWITLCDFQGRYSETTGTYNITEVPSNYLIDKEGNIIAKNIYGEELIKRLSELFSR